jgi:aminobenzoyl-glutamate utilization protein A
MQPHEISLLRRRFHAHAEPGFLEYHTAATVIAILRDLGVPHLVGAQAMSMDAVAVPPSAAEHEEWARRAHEAGVAPELVESFRKEGTAVIAHLRGNRPGPVWGLRIDMDALPIEEDTDSAHLPVAAGFRSTTPYMHACGHDGHTAIGVALAARLADGDFPGEVRVLFQPAEEGVRGAAPMINAGAVEGIERMLAVHLRSVMPLGVIVGGVDNAMATTKWMAEFTGEPSHASAAPEKGRNAMAAAAHATLAILGVSRFSSSDTRVNVGTFHAGGSANVVPASATLTYEVRAFSNEVLDELNRRVESIVHGAAKMHDVAVDAKVYGEAGTSIPDPEILEALAAAAESIPAITQFVGRSSAAGGSDDAHSMISTVQKNGGIGAYIMVGAQINDAPHHHFRFDVDEAALEVTVDLLESVFRNSAGSTTKSA